MRQVWSNGEADLGLDSMHTTSLGAAIFTLRRPYNALFWWEVRFDVLVGSTSQVGSEGFSLCVGELPDAGFGESGVGTGLRVNFKTAYDGFYETLELWYAEVMLHQVELGRWLRTATWASVRIRHDQHGLSVWHGGRRWVTDYQIRGWDPQPSWRLGIGARAGRWPERHWLDWLELESEMLARPRPALTPTPRYAHARPLALSRSRRPLSPSLRAPLHPAAPCPRSPLTLVAGGGGRDHPRALDQRPAVLLGRRRLRLPCYADRLQRHARQRADWRRHSRHRLRLQA